jgi:hypothetical protein
MRSAGFWLGAAAAGVLGLAALNLLADRTGSPGARAFRNYLVGSR